MVKDLKELEKLLKLCRKQGVMDLSWDGITFKMGELPQEKHELGATPDLDDDKWSNFPAGELSPTQLAFYSSGGNPEDDPELSQ